MNIELTVEQRKQIEKIQGEIHKQLVVSRNASEAALKLVGELRLYQTECEIAFFKATRPIN